MARFLVRPEDIRGKQIVIRGTEARHALYVLRFKVGDEIDCFDGKDASFRARIVSRRSDDDLDAEILEVRAAEQQTQGHVTLCQGLLKGPKWDWFLEKACELGVHRVIPLVSERTIVKSTERDPHKIERWQKIVLAASKQCGRNELMRVDAPRSFNEVLEERPSSAEAFIPWEKEDATPLRNISSKEVWIFIGPEGGWDEKEVALAQRRGIKPVRLGPTLLRSETAGLVAATLALREFGLY